MIPRATSTWLSRVVLLTLAFALAGCGGPDPQALLDGAQAALEDAGTSRFVMQVETVGDEGAPPFTAEGAQDLGSGALRMDIDLGDEATRTETLLLGAEIFIRSPLFALFTGDETTWVRVDLEATAAEQGLDTDALLGDQTGPAALLAQLQGASGDLEELGSEEVRGVATTHLRVSVDTQAAIEQADPAVREQLRSYAEATGLPDTYPMELWIDEDGLVRRIRTVLDVAGAAGAGGEAGSEAGGAAGGAAGETAGGAGGAAGVTQQTTLELFDFGVRVDLDPPLPEQTVELQELVADLERLEELDGAGAAS